MAGQEGGEPWRRNAPLPEFIPENLFSNLNLPEVQIRLPPPIRPDGDDVMVMPIGQAMRDFAPGAFSRRFGLRHERERHWLAPQLDGAREQAVPLENFVNADPVGSWMIDCSGRVARVPVYRPRELRVTVPPPDVVDTSNARLRWRSQIVARTPGPTFRTPSGSGWLRSWRNCISLHIKVIARLRFAVSRWAATPIYSSRTGVRQRKSSSLRPMLSAPL